MLKMLCEVAAISIFATAVFVVGVGAAKAGEMERNYGATAGLIQYVDGKCADTLEVTDAGRTIQNVYLKMTDDESQTAWFAAIENTDRMEKVAVAAGADKPSRAVCLYIGTKAPELVRFK